MNQQNTSYLWIAFLFLLTTCQKEEIGMRSFPRLETLAVADITDEGAVFTARIFEQGEEEILRHGFVWGDFPTPSVSEDFEQSMEGAPTGNEFSAAIITGLRINRRYYVRAFIETTERIVYGTEVVFVSQGSSVPVLNSISPQTGSWGDTITVRGKFFSADSTRNKAFLGEVELLALSASDTLLQFVVPPIFNGTVATFSLAVIGVKTSETKEFTYTQVEILDFTPKLPTFGDTVRLSIANLNPDYYALTLDGTALEAVEAGTDYLKIVIPNSAARAFPEVALLSAGVESKEVIPLANPELSELTTRNYSYGDTIRFAYLNIHPELEKNTLRLTDAGQDWILAPARLTADSIYFVLSSDIIPDPSILLRFRTGPFSINTGFIELNEPEVNELPVSLFREVGQEVVALGRYLNPDPTYFEVILLVNNEALRLPPQQIIEINRQQVRFRLDQSFFQFFLNPGFDGRAELLFTNHNQTVGRFSILLENRSPWQNRADLPIGVLTGNVAFSVNGKGYYGIGEIAGRNTNVFYEYNPASNRWRRLADFIGPSRANATPIVLADQVLLGLGLDETGTTPRTFKDVYLFDPGAGTWTQQADFPGDARYDAQALRDNGRYYLAGGRNETGSTIDFRQEIWQYLPGSATWQQLDQDLPPFGSSVTVGEVGYLSSSFNFYRYDEGQWTAFDRRTFNLQGELVPIGDKIYWGFEEVSPSIAVFDTNTGLTAIRSFNLANRRIIDYLFTIDGLAYFIVEGLAGESPRQVWAFDPTKF